MACTLTLCAQFTLVVEAYRKVSKQWSATFNRIDTGKDEGMVCCMLERVKLAGQPHLFRLHLQLATCLSPAASITTSSCNQ